MKGNMKITIKKMNKNTTVPFYSIIQKLKLETLYDWDIYTDDGYYNTRSLKRTWKRDATNEEEVAAVEKQYGFSNYNEITVTCFDIKWDTWYEDLEKHFVDVYCDYKFFVEVTTRVEF